MIELAQNGMVDGDSGAPLPERLDCLRKYSSSFRNGIFDHEDLAAHPNYVSRMVDFSINTAVPLLCGYRSTAALYYGNRHPGRSEFFLSAFIPGSAAAGIPSCRWVSPFAAPDEPVRLVKKCEADLGQDLLVTVEVDDRPVPVGTTGRGYVSCFLARNREPTKYGFVVDPICNFQGDRDLFLFTKRLKGPVHDSPGCSPTMRASSSYPIW